MFPSAVETEHLVFSVALSLASMNGGGKSHVFRHCSFLTHSEYPPHELYTVVTCLIIARGNP